MVQITKQPSRMFWTSNDVCTAEETLLCHTRKVLDLRSRSKPTAKGKRTKSTCTLWSQALAQTLACFSWHSVAVVQRRESLARQRGEMCLRYGAPWRRSDLLSSCSRDYHFSCSRLVSDTLNRELRVGNESYICDTLAGLVLSPLKSNTPCN
jgi:hypothetical protein